MKYMMLVCVEEGDRAARRGGRDDRAGHEAWVSEMDGRGVRVQGERAGAACTDATTIRVRGGEVVIADGPFAETKEQIAGFDILECADLDEAIEVAAKHPVARFGSLELRPFAEG